VHLEAQLAAAQARLTAAQVALSMVSELQARKTAHVTVAQFLPCGPRSGW
jgi:hypothetical protein